MSIKKQSSVALNALGSTVTASVAHTHTFSQGCRVHSHWIHGAAPGSWLCVSAGSLTTARDGALHGEK